MNQSLLQRAANFYRDRKRREQYFIIGGAVIMYALVVFVLVMTFKGYIDQTNSKLSDYETALDTLTTVAPKYLEQKGQGNGNQKLDNFSDDKLVGNDIQLRSFVSRHAGNAGFSFDSYPTDTRQLGSKEDDSINVTEVELKADVREVDYEKLISLLRAIEKTDKPVYVYRLRLTQYRNRPGKLTATVYVLTFRIPKSS